MNEIMVSPNDEIVIKLLHYFVTEQGYNPIILHGAKDEIWLEKLNSDYKIIRIVSNYIHNNEQLNYDLYKTKQIVKSIKRKTFSFNMDTLSIFVNLGENVEMKQEKSGHILCANIKKDDDITKYNFIVEAFPNIDKKLTFKEKGIELFLKVTDEINKKNTTEVKKNEETFKIIKPYITYALIFINAVMFLLTIMYGEVILYEGGMHAETVKAGEYYRIITSIFLHANIWHFLFNNYALYVLGQQLESYLGKGKYLTVYLFSGVAGNLLTMALGKNYLSVGASGAIFGLLGALLYFGYHYRVYLGNVMKSQIIPLIILNLIIGFVVSGINNIAHIGGLIAGFIILTALGVKYKSSTAERVNGVVIATIFTVFLVYIAFIK